jgi:hypothetical protein
VRLVRKGLQVLLVRLVLQALMGLLLMRLGLLSSLRLFLGPVREINFK